MTIFIPGWVMAIPLVIGGIVGMFAAVKYAKPEHRNWWLLAVIAGMFAYYFGISVFEVHDEPPAIQVPFSISGNNAAV